MNKFTKFFALVLLCTTAVIARDCPTLCANDNAGIRTFILPRSQGSNTAMQLVGWQDFIHQCDTECFYGVADVRFEYSRTFRPERIAEQLFGASTMHFQGSNVKAGLVSGITPRPDALIADYFGLSTNFDGAICFSPQIDNFITDFNFYFCLDTWYCGLYFEAHLPIVRTRWTLFDCDTKNQCNNAQTTSSCNQSCVPIQSNGNTTPFIGGYMNSLSPRTPTVPLPAVLPTGDLLTALSGTYKFGDMQTNWIGGIIPGCRLHKTRIADVELQFGWDFLKCENSHLGIFLEIVAPTGGRAAFANTLFAPVIGTAGHAELGAGLSGHYDLWANEDQLLAFWVYGNVTHGFKKSQARTFDYNTGPFSRYILLKELDANNNYTGNLVNGVNFSTRVIETAISVKGDASFKLAYNYCGFRFDVGYNIYGDSGERYSNKKNCNQFTEGILADRTNGISGCTLSACNGLDPSRKFGFKGCLPVAGQLYETETVANITTLTGDLAPAPASGPLRLNSTASNATAFSCGTIDSPSNVVTFLGTTALAYNSLTTAGLQVSPVAAAGVLFAQNSATPKILSVADLNICSGLGRSQITHKIFGYAGYSWMDNCHTPFIGFLWEVEWAQGVRRNTNNCSINNTNTNGCNFNNPMVDYSVNTDSVTSTNEGMNKHRGGVSIWGVGFKGGLTF